MENLSAAKVGPRAAAAAARCPDRRPRGRPDQGGALHTIRLKFPANYYIPAIRTGRRERLGRLGLALHGDGHQVEQEPELASAWEDSP